MALKLENMPEHYCVCRLDGDAVVPAWVPGSGSHSFVSVTRTADELSIFLPQDAVPTNVMVAAKDSGWRGLKLIGPFEFTEVGILVQLLVPLRDAGIGMLAMSTFDTDYVFVKEENLERAVACLEAAGLQMV